MQSLVFFNKEGDNLNFTYNQEKERWEGDLLFDENSDDTFKTIGLYTFEKIKSFDYENVGEMKLRKFQLFNEFRLTFSGNSNFTQSIKKIEMTNSDPTFFSKWIYGENFESKFPKGSKIRFDSPIFEFTNTISVYTVISTKKDAIMILSNTDNKIFESNYGLLIDRESSYVSKSISGVNSIGFYNHMTGTKENFSEWSEPDFYNKIYDGKKLNIVNTKLNDGIVTVKNKNLLDTVYSKYVFTRFTLSDDSDFIAKLILKTESPNVYTGGIVADGFKLQFSQVIPIVLKTGSVFTIKSSTLNYNFITVDYIPQFTGNTNLTFYPLQSQVIWNNLIYQCIQPYTWTATSSITPDNPRYWARPTYLPTTTELYYEQIGKTEIHLASNIFEYKQTFTQSSSVTLDSFAQKYKDEFNFFDLDLYYKDNALNVDLIHPSKYCLVEFYQSTTGDKNYASEVVINEYNVETKEILNSEINVDVNENFRYDIIFTDLDEFGLKITINKQVYNQEIKWVYESSQINYPRSIDQTIRQWFDKWYIDLFLLGIRVKILSRGGLFSSFYNTISLYTVYPNVPLDFDVEVGITAEYFIDHSEITFRDISNYLSLNINDKSYGISSVTSSVPTANTFEIPDTVSSWVAQYQDELSDYGIYVSSISNTLIFRTKTQNQRLEYTVQVGKSSLPSDDLYNIENKQKGHFGSLLSSNEIFFKDSIEFLDLDPSITPTTPQEEVNIIPSTYSFEQLGFAVGQVVGINNTIYPWNNQEFNIIYVDPKQMILDYRGPFWSIVDPECILSPFFIISYNKAWGATRCITVTPPSIYGSEFTLDEFRPSFLIDIKKNTYKSDQYNIDADTKLIDIIYSPSTENFYILGTKLLTVDARDTNVTNSLNLPGMTDPISLSLNPINDFIYCLSKTDVYIVDSRLNSIKGILKFQNEIPIKLKINSVNGDIHIIYQNSILSKVWKSRNFSPTPDFILTFNQNLVDLEFNPVENLMYYALSDGTITTVNGKTKEINTNTYNFTTPVDKLFYEESESAIYFFDGFGLNKINNGNVLNISEVTRQSENYLVYNNVLEQMVVSQTTQFISFRTSGSIITKTNTVLPGQMDVNQFDGDVYQISGKDLKVLDTINGGTKWSETYPSNIKKIIFNPIRNTIFGIIPSIPGVFEQSTLFEVIVTLSSSSTTTNSQNITSDDNLYGSLDPNNVQRKDLWLNVKEFIRKPKANFNDDFPVDLIWKWEDDQTPEMFFYDFSGKQLITTGSYSYTGPKPLPRAALNNSPNTDISKVKIPEFQQTIFDEIIDRLGYLDDDVDIKSEPEPIEVFLGFNSKDEGVKKSVLKLLVREDITLTITSSPTNFDVIQFTKRKDGLLAINLSNSSDKNFFTDGTNKTTGLKVGQILQIFITDVTNTRNKYVSFNNGVKVKIKFVFYKSLICEKIDQDFYEEFSVIENYPKIGDTTYFSVVLKTVDKEIGSFNVYGQTQIEDIRYKVELTNTGQLVSPEETYIFKSYDLNEQGIDWGYLNKKRKELLMVRDQIYPYIGSYKSIINSINYFGYNDLEFYEYYRNVNENSKDFGKLFKVEIPDIFDNSIPGWTPNDFIKHTLPNTNFEDTNLFNLTFKITDKEGTNVLIYSLYEVLLKLQGLKMWLQKNVIPLTHKILDITGRTDFSGITTIQHRNYDTQIINITQDFSPYDFKLSEAYLMPINSGSTVYNCVIDFSVEKSELKAPCFFLKVRTYQTQKEWQPLRIYNKGDKVMYFQQIYESVINSNRSKNPRKYEMVNDWSIKSNYNLGDYAIYERDTYQYIGTQSSNTYYVGVPPSPKTDILNNGSFAKWLIMTEWKKVEYLPIQTLTEFRTATHSYSFTVDSNLDPFVLIEVTSDNGYGQNYTNKKTYEIRGTKDLLEDPGKPDAMGPFNPTVYSDPNLLPELRLTPNTEVIPPLYALESYELVVESPKNILQWTITDVVRINCFVYINITKITSKSAKVTIDVDRKSTKSGNFSFTIKSVVSGGYVGEKFVTGKVLSFGYSYAGGIGLSNLM